MNHRMGRGRWEHMPISDNGKESVIMRGGGRWILVGMDGDEWKCVGKVSWGRLRMDMDGLMKVEGRGRDASG